MSEYMEHTLMETPELRDAGRQQALTDRFLTPALAAIEILLRGLRAELDPSLAREAPTFDGKPYPLGQCREITEAIHQRLGELDPAALCGPAAEGCIAFRRFVAAGGTVRRAWGDLRGQYFQNALIVGTLYVDVSNDTVVVTKPPVEILPFADAGFTPIADYGHYARIAARYWRSRILPNHLLPRLAPYLPLIEIGPTGRLRLGPLNRYMLGLTLSKGFAPSEQALAGPLLPPTLFAGLASALRGSPTGVAESAADGRTAALAWCGAYRAEGRADCAATFNGAMATGRAVNRQLASLIVIPQAA